MSFADLVALDARLGLLLAAAADSPLIPWRQEVLADLAQLCGPARSPHHPVLSTQEAYETAKVAILAELAG